MSMSVSLNNLLSVLTSIIIPKNVIAVNPNPNPWRLACDVPLRQCGRRPSTPYLLYILQLTGYIATSDMTSWR
jgi:hypothetical protein